MQNLNAFYEALQGEVIDEAGGAGYASDEVSPDFKENAFTRIITEDLALAGVLESPLTCHYEATIGGAVIKVSAYSIPEEDSRIDLVISHYSAAEGPGKLNGTDVDRLLGHALRFFKASIAGRHQSVEPGTDAFAMMQEIHSFQESIDRVNILLLTNSLSVQRKERSRNETFGNYRVSYDIWDIERLRRLRSIGSTHEPIEVDLSGNEGVGIPCIAVKESLLGYTTTVAMLDGNVLHDWYDEFGSRLLELNVRSYLQARGKINKGILETLVKEPHKFLAYNNGVTIVAEELAFNKEGTRIMSIRGLQIVNGGQTTASIHRARKEHGADLSKVQVQAKITVIPPESFEVMVPLISRFSNTQNKVSEVDLGANHSYHVGIERVAKRLWSPGEQSMWFYERARGGYQTERSKTATTPKQKSEFDKKYPPNQRFSKEDLARYSNIWNGLPYIVSRGGQKNFTRFMEAVPNVEKDWEPSTEEFKTLIAKAILYRKAQQIARELEIPAFRINVVNYCVALVAEKTARRIDLISIWDRHDLPDALAGQIKSWMPLVAGFLTTSAGSRNPTEWFKSEQCWKQLIEEARGWETQPGLMTQLRQVGSADTSSSETVQNNIARCLEVDAQTWFRIQIWGSESGQLQEWQTGIANTLAGYAAQGWRKKPSEKQAKHAIEMVRLYKEANSE